MTKPFRQVLRRLAGLLTVAFLAASAGGQSGNSGREPRTHKPAPQVPRGQDYGG